MTPLDSWTNAQLAALHLFRDGGSLQIRWTDDANIHAMTLGRHLGPHSRDKTALVFEAPDGTSPARPLRRWTAPPPFLPQRCAQTALGGAI